MAWPHSWQATAAAATLREEYTLSLRLTVNVRGSKWSVRCPLTCVTRTLSMPLSRSIFSASSAPVMPPGEDTSEYFENTLCRRACTMYPTTAMRIMRIIEPEVDIFENTDPSAAPCDTRST